MPRATPLQYVLLAFLGLVWGSSFLFIKVALDDMTPVTLAAVRIGLGATILWLAVLVTGKRLPRERRFWGYMFAIGLVGFALPFVMVNVGQQYIESALGAILISAVPLFTLALAHFFTDDRFTMNKLGGVVLGFGGIVLLLGPTALLGLVDSLIGMLLTLGAALGFALTTVMARRAGNAHPFVSGACSLSFAGLYMIPAAFLLESPLSLAPGAMSMAAMVALAVFSTGVAMIVFFVLAASAGPNFVAMNNFIAPAVGVAWGAILLSEPITWQKIAAVALILAGIAVATRRRAPGAATPSPGASG